MAIHYKEEQKALAGSQKVMRKMLALIPVLAVAVLCYSVTVCAWFSAEITNTGNVIQTATYELDISVIGPDGTEVTPTDGAYALTDGNGYTVTLTAKGSASTGYCEIQTKDETYCTKPVKPGDKLTLTIYRSGSYTFTARWGKHDGETISDGVIGQSPSGSGAGLPADTGDEQTADAVYEVQRNDTLEKIARAYGTSIKKLAAYNGIEDPDYIQEGQLLKIPPEDYEIPSAPADAGDTEQTGSEPEQQAPAAEPDAESGNASAGTEPTDGSSVTEEPESTPESGVSSVSPTAPAEAGRLS